MDEQTSGRYHVTRKADILAMSDDHARAWRPILSGRYGKGLAVAVVEEARRRQEALIPAIPYIGGDENPMTRHLIRSTTSLVLYQAMNAHGRTAEETGHVLYQAVKARVRRLPLLAPTSELARKREQARESQKRRHSGGWVWEFVEGDGREFDYGYDFTECGTQKLFQAHGADEFLPFYCYLDFATYRRPAGASAGP